LGGLGVKVQHFQLTLLVVLTTLTLSCERDIAAALTSAKSGQNLAKAGLGRISKKWQDSGFARARAEIRYNPKFKSSK